MPPVCRLNDVLITGHGCTVISALTFPGQASVLAMTQPMARIGDPTYVHTIGSPPICPPHIGFVILGSPTVFVVGKPQARIRDAVDTPAGQMITGAVTVWADAGSGPGAGTAQGPGF
jgi:uncharacterized Zn-binding protein involved in type VI secretion